jgi:AcrR family transcriptional regulator
MVVSGGRAAIRSTPRPPNRKAQIVAAAADLFYRRGYHNVSTRDIAQEVGITAGALYRHFSSKQDLLAQALIDAFDRATAVVRDEAPEDLEEMVRRLTLTAGSRRDLGVLWNRESRHLDADHKKQMRGRFFAFLSELVAQLRATRPELSAAGAQLLAWCAVGVLTSPSYHSTQMDLDDTTELMRRLTLAVCTAPLAAHERAGEVSAPEQGLVPGSRRESILAASTQLFDKHGYQSTSMGDVGAAVGITNAGVYKYFASKADLLSAVIARASEPLQLGLVQALASARSHEEGLSEALDAYVDFALVHHHLLGILVSEVMNLPEPQRGTVRRAQLDYVSEWTRLLRDARPQVDERRARFMVQAVLTMVNDATRTGQLRQRPALGQDLRLLGRRLLSVEL